MKKAHIISHTHWDREWYLPYETHHMMLVNTMDTLLNTFEKDSNFKYYHLDGQTILLEDYLEVRPDKKDLLEKVIKEGKLKIGPWYVLQDEFLTSSESNIRNLQYGHKDSYRYNKDVTKIGYFPDSFGNMGQAPQILKQAGINTAAFGRGVKPTGFNNEVSANDDFESPYSEMYWESPDGSRVLGILFANWYCNGMEIPTDINQSKEYWDKKLDESNKFASSNQLLFMNGCDHQPIQTDLSEALNIANSIYNDIEFVHSNFDDYISDLHKEMNENLQVIKGELKSQKTDGWYTLVNTASARIYLKQWNQLCQTLFEKVAEPLATMAYKFGFDYPHHLFEYGWKSLMKNHPHDSICGCSIDEVHKEMEARFDKAKDIAKYIINESLEYISSKVNTLQFEKFGPEVYPFIVVNTSGYNRNGIVDVEIDVVRKYFKEGIPNEIAKEIKNIKLPQYKVIDKDGNKISAKIIDMGIKFDYDLPKDKFRQPYYCRRIKVELESKEIKSFGWDTYALVKDNGAVKSSESLINENYLENEYLKVEINENGSFNIEDKINNEVYTDLGIYENTGDIGNEYIYMQPVNDIGITTKDLKAKIEVKEDLPYKVVIEITHNWSIPKGANELLDTEIKEVLEFNKRKSQRSKDYIDFIIKTELILEKSSKGLKVKTTFNNVAKNHRLRALYPTDTNTSNHYSDSVFEVVKRNNEVSNEWENPSNCQHQHAFVNIKADDRGLTIANKGLNEYEVLRDDRNTVAITILRSVGELGDWGVFYTPEAQCLGEHSVELEILPCNKDSYESYKDAHLFQIPIIAKQINLQNGELEIKANLMELNGYGIMWSTLKLDYKNNYIVRVYNIYDNDAKLEFKDCSIEGKQYISNILEEKTENYIDTTVKLNKFEIKTIGIEKKCN